MKSIIVYQAGQVAPRMFDPGAIADSNLYPGVKNMSAFVPYNPPKPIERSTVKQVEAQKKDDVQAVAAAYQNLVVHMSKMKSDMTKMMSEIQDLKDQIELLKIPDVDALYKIDPLETSERNKNIAYEEVGYKESIEQDRSTDMSDEKMELMDQTMLTEEEVEIEAPKNTTRRKLKSK
jgi:hypothetical protein